MLRFPSIKNLTYGVEQVVRRFPLVVVAAAFKAVMLYILIESPPVPNPPPLYLKTTLVLFLALPLFLSLHLVAERRKWSLGVLAAGVLGVVALLVLYYFTISPSPIQRDYYRFGMFLVCAHLLVSFAPFVGYDEPNGFWQFNKTMLLQFLTATLYAGTLYIGIIIAVETVRFLFDVTYSTRIELDLFVLIGGFFHTLFFLNGFPAQLDLLEAQKSYSRGVKLFTQYVLLPLEVVYLLILYVYTAKILIQWQLPEGGVAYLVMAFSVAGIFALLLLYPIRDSAEERWIRLYSQRFYLALFPLIVLLGVAIFRRIGEYGVTENRYLVAALAVWLTGVTLYFLISKKDDIRWIPLSLCVASFLLAVGPWSIFAYSRQNQAERFGSLLREYKLLDNSGKIASADTLPREDYERLVSGIRYFRDRNEINTLTPFFSALPDTKNQQEVATQMEYQLNKAVNVKELQLGNSGRVDYAISGNTDMFGVNIRGFDYMISFNLYSDASREDEAGKWKLTASDRGSKLVLSDINNEEIAAWDMAARFTEIEKQYGMSTFLVDSKFLTFDRPGMRLKLEKFSRSGGYYSYQGVLLMKER
ncbi:DUF4153 domain-containing protein [Persicitalea jodogahamensis]|uniref:DUF4153 domain-containing protein n=1 Tax=Persicitalea jodogahamensis TaxID=402147 RepID=A0A8J3GA23_9BACT|nr:DUF4153 domain-containing protein [Persicitalea jodogahamensis]GHB69208.1 hypothetical protein GCM10007390_23430 [Persicitalea jodogahamensis]